jgi:hypothetical protein
MFNEAKVKALLADYYWGLSSDKSQKGIKKGEIIKELKTDVDIEKNYTSKEISEMITKYDTESILVNDSKKDDFEQKVVLSIKQELFKISEWTFIIPIENMKLYNKITIGNVKFALFNNNTRKKYRKKLRAFLYLNPNYDMMTKKRFFEDYSERFFDSILGKSCAFVTEEGNIDKIRFRVYDNIITCLAVLKLFRYPNDDFYRRYFHIKGEVHTSIRSTFIYKENWSGIYPYIDRIGYMYEYDVNKDKILYLKKLGFNKVNYILRKNKLNEIEAILINSIRFYGEAYDIQIASSIDEAPPKTLYDAFSMSDRLIKLFTTLESFLIFDNSEPLQSNLSERCALLISKKYERRKTIKRFVLEMYSKRSGHVHHGQPDITEKELNEFMTIVQSCILEAIKLTIKNKFENKADLKEWFEKEKLS